MSELVYINGKEFSDKDAKISVYDRGFLFGDAIYEVTRSYGKILFQLEHHLDRLFTSAERIQFQIDKSKEQYIKHIYDIYKKTKLENVYLRIQVTRGEGPIGMSMKLAKSLNEVIYIFPFHEYPEELFKKGADVCVTDRLRNSKKALDPDIKSGNYLNNVLAFAEGEKINAHETFMVNKDGHLTEGCTSNIFMVKNSIVYTPPQSFDILKGITRRIVMEKAKSNGLKVEEKGFSLEDLTQADEVFLTSSLREVMPIASINKMPIKKSPGEITKKLMGFYKEYVENYCREAKNKHPWN